MLHQISGSHSECLERSYIHRQQILAQAINALSSWLTIKEYKEAAVNTLLQALDLNPTYVLATTLLRGFSLPLRFEQ